MLSIGAMAGGQGKYYLQLAREDYYFEGGEPLGKWWGKGASHLGLKSTVKKAELEALLSGFRPDGSAAIQNAGHKRHQPGWDLTFSAPKSVSVLWSQADELTRRIIQEAHYDAIKDALEYVQDEVAFTRRGKGGLVHERIGLIVATFEHGTSRALEPQLHTHALLLNIGVRTDGTTGTVLSKPYYQAKMTIGALYRASLAHNLTKSLGLICEQEKSWFEISGVPKRVIDFFSTRRAEIKKELSEKGLETASSAAMAALKTRKHKDVVPPREELFAKWRADGEKLGFSASHCHSFKRGMFTRGAAPERLVRHAIDQITEQESHFTARDLLRKTAELSPAHGIPAGELRKATKNVLQDGNGITFLGEWAGQGHYTTSKMMATERTLLETANAMQAGSQVGVSTRTINSIIKNFSNERSPLFEELRHHARESIKAAKKERGTPLDRDKIRKDARVVFSADQQAALRHLTEKSQRRIRIVEGAAGSGKTLMLRAVREAWEKSGYTVIGAALSGKARRELQDGSGINSLTLRQLEFRMKPTLAYKLKHHAKQLLRAAQRKQTYRLKPLKIDKKTVLVVDEAGMIGTNQMTRIVEAVKKGAGILILVGDRTQLQPIEAGAPFAALSDRLGVARMTENRRQKDTRDKQLVKDAAEGKAQSVVESLSERGRFFVSKNRDEAIDKLIDDWCTNEKGNRDASLIFCGTNSDVNEVNGRCQDRRIDEGELDTSKKIVRGDTPIYSGDRILLRKTKHPLGVSRGDTGTVLTVNSLTGTCTVQLHHGRTVVIPRSFKDVALGYAMTTHMGQGTTTENAYVLAGGPMQDKEISHVQVSRAKQSTRVYADEESAGPKLKTLISNMTKSRTKTLARDALDHYQRQQQAQQQAQQQTQMR